MNTVLFFVKNIFWRRNIVCFFGICNKSRQNWEVRSVQLLNAHRLSAQLSCPVILKPPRNFLACPLCPCRLYPSPPRQLRACLLEQLPVEPVCTPCTASLHTQLALVRARLLALSKAGCHASLMPKIRVCGHSWEWLGYLNQQVFFMVCSKDM